MSEFCVNDEIVLFTKNTSAIARVVELDIAKSWHPDIKFTKIICVANEYNTILALGKIMSADSFVVFTAAGLNLGPYKLGSFVCGENTRELLIYDPAQKAEKPVWAERVSGA